MGKVWKKAKKIVKKVTKPISKIVKRTARRIKKIGKAVMAGVSKISNKLGVTVECVVGCKYSELKAIIEVLNATE